MHVSSTTHQASTRGKWWTAAAILPGQLTIAFGMRFSHGWSTGSVKRQINRLAPNQWTVNSCERPKYGVSEPSRPDFQVPSWRMRYVPGTAVLGMVHCTVFCEQAKVGKQLSRAHMYFVSQSQSRATTDHVPSAFFCWTWRKLSWMRRLFFGCPPQKTTVTVWPR